MVWDISDVWKRRVGVGGLDLGMAKYSRYKVFSFSEGSKKVLSGIEWLLI